MMYLLATMVICSMVVITPGNTNYKHLQCLLNVLKLKNFLDVIDGTCQETETVELFGKDFKTLLNQTCEKTCHYTTGFGQVNTFTDNIICNSYLYLNITIDKKNVYRGFYSTKGCSGDNSCYTEHVRFTCDMPKYAWDVKNLFLDEKDEQESDTPCPTKITSTTTSIPKTAICEPCPVMTSDKKPETSAATCEPCPVIKPDEQQETPTSSSYTEFLQDDTDCAVVAVGVGFGCLGIVIGVIITSAICICWSQRKQSRRNFEGQAMNNKAYLITGVEQNNDVESKPRQRSVIYSEINDETTHGNPKVSHVAPMIRDTEGKGTDASHDKDVYNHLNEEINEDDVDDYDHARPVPVQNNEADNTYGKLDKTAAMSKSMQDDKQISSSIVNHDYGELEVVETGGVKRLDNETKKMESDEDVRNEDSGNYFTLEKSQI